MTHDLSKAVRTRILTQAAETDAWTGSPTQLAMTEFAPEYDDFTFGLSHSCFFHAPAGISEGATRFQPRQIYLDVEPLASALRRRILRDPHSARQ